MRVSPLRAVAPALVVLACTLPPAVTPVPSVRIRALAARVESARELRFLAPVAAEEVETAGVPALLARELDRLTPPEQMRREGALAGSHGLLPQGAGQVELALGL